MKTPIAWILVAACLHFEHTTVTGFVSSLHNRRVPFKRYSTSALSSGAPGSTVEGEQSVSSVQVSEEGNSTSVQSSSVVRAPLKFVGPYPCLALRFPQLATSSQRARNVTGISLDFVLDTAANTNTINAQVATELGLEVVGSALPGLGAGGALSGGDTYLLGDCELDGLPKEDKFTFMSELTASALPVASPAAAGLLSLAFFNCFPGGVEFDWGSVEKDRPPSITFHGDDENTNFHDIVRVPIKPLPVTLLPSVTIRINGKDIPALLDTGSPITVLNAQAAKVVGAEIAKVPTSPESKSMNPFENMAKNFKAAQAAAKAAASGDVLAIAGSNGERVELLKSKSKLNVGVVGDGQDTSWGESHVYVGDLPGLAALGGLGGESRPAAVLGMDVLRLRPRLLFRGQTNEVYL